MDHIMDHIMDHQLLQQRFAALTTAHLADACIHATKPETPSEKCLRNAFRIGYLLVAVAIFPSP
jgi:hypothetical protein